MDRTAAKKTLDSSGESMHPCRSCCRTSNHPENFLCLTVHLHSYPTIECCRIAAIICGGTLMRIEVPTTRRYGRPVPKYLLEVNETLARTGIFLVFDPVAAAWYHLICGRPAWAESTLFLQRDATQCCLSHSVLSFLLLWVAVPFHCCRTFPYPRTGKNNA